MILVRHPHCWRFLFPLAPDRRSRPPKTLRDKVLAFIGDVRRRARARQGDLSGAPSRRHRMAARPRVPDGRCGAPDHADVGARPQYRPDRLLEPVLAARLVSARLGRRARARRLRARAEAGRAVRRRRDGGSRAPLYRQGGRQLGGHRRQRLGQCLHARHAGRATGRGRKRGLVDGQERGGAAAPPRRPHPRLAAAHSRGGEVRRARSHSPTALPRFYFTDVRRAAAGPARRLAGPEAFRSYRAGTRRSSEICARVRCSTRAARSSGASAADPRRWSLFVRTSISPRSSRSRRTPPSASMPRSTARRRRPGETDHTTLSLATARQSISNSRSRTGGRLKCQVRPKRAAPRHTISSAKNEWMSCTV